MGLILTAIIEGTNMYDLKELLPGPPNASISIFDIDEDGEAEIVLLNDTSHRDD